MPTSIADKQVPKASSHTTSGSYSSRRRAHERNVTWGQENARKSRFHGLLHNFHTTATSSRRTQRQRQAAVKPPYYGQRQQRPGWTLPFPEAGRGFSELFPHLPTQMVSKPGVTTQVIQGSLPPFSSRTAPTTTSGVAAQRYYGFSRTDALPSTMPGINPDCGHIAEKYRHAFDGGEWFLIKEHHVMTTMNMKLEPSLEMYATTTFTSPGVLRRTSLYVGRKLKIRKNFMAKVAARIGRALDEDVYIPLYPREVLENRSGARAVFFHHQFLSCLKLMKNVLSWQGLLTEEPLKELSLCSLLNRYLIVALQADLSQRVKNVENVETVEKCTRLVSTLPTSWLRGSQLPQLQLLTRFLRLYLPHLEGVFGSSNLGPDMHARFYKQAFLEYCGGTLDGQGHMSKPFSFFFPRDPLEEVQELLASLTDKTK
ncbi:hypothetical protein MRX96_013708 [Rhipicephalus microplus]